MRTIDADHFRDYVLRGKPIGLTICEYSESDILYMIKAQPTISPPPNDPLTLEELREMDGEPVWIDDWFEDFHGWELSETASDYFEGDSRTVEAYGTRWLAYRRKPEEGTT